MRLAEARGADTRVPEAPVIDGIDLVHRYADSTAQTYRRSEQVPVRGMVSGDWLELLYRGEAATSRVQRSVYELCVFTALRERLRCKEIWVEGADKWRNPDADLPADFETRRLEHYRALAKPLDPAEFIEPLQAQMREELLALQQALPSCDWLRITDKRGGQITLSPLEEAPEPRNLRRLKAEVGRRWGLVPLLDMLKEAALRVGLLEHFAPAGARESMDRGELAEKLILWLFGYGTNIGLRSIAGGEHGHTEDELRYVRRRYMSTPTPGRPRRPTGCRLSGGTTNWCALPTARWPALPRHAAVAAYLHERDGDPVTAARLYAEAARSAPNLPERDHLTRQAARLNAQLRS
jgi:hypothetical protein